MKQKPCPLNLQNIAGFPEITCTRGAGQVLLCVAMCCYVTVRVGRLWCEADKLECVTMVTTASVAMVTGVTQR